MYQCHGVLGIAVCAHGWLRYPTTVNLYHHCGMANSTFKKSYRNAQTMHTSKIFMHRYYREYMVEVCMYTAFIRFHTHHICDQACKNQPCECKKSPIFCLCFTITYKLFIYTDSIKSLSLVLNLMDFPLKFTKMR